MKRNAQDTAGWMQHSAAVSTAFIVSAVLCGCEQLPRFSPEAGVAINSAQPSPGPERGPGSPDSAVHGRTPRKPDRDGGAHSAEAVGDAGPGSCSRAMAMRCASAPGQRERCEDGSWTPAEPCADGEVCVASGQDAGCQSVAATCQGSAGQAACDDTGTLYDCSEAGLITNMISCPSPRHCVLGRDTGACAMCVPTSTDGFRCKGVELERCLSDGSGYEPFKTCDTEALCNAQAGDCTSSACSSGQKLCDGDVLMECAADRSQFTVLRECDAGLCNAETGACGACVPDSSSCADDTTALICDPDGSELVRKPCPAERPVCVGNGRCVQCGSTEDCGEAATCEVVFCDLASGKCEPQPAEARTPCRGGLCDGRGECRQCLDAARDCPDVGVCQDKHCDQETGKCEPRPAPEDRSCNETGRCDGSGRCNQCEPGDRMCDGDAVLTCRADGQGYSRSACPGGMCVGKGECVECTTDGDCDHLDAGCTVGVCRNGKCETGDATNGKQCRDVLDRRGSCLNGSCACTPQCDDKDCGGDGCGGTCPDRCRGSQTCLDDACVDCVRDSDCRSYDSADGCRVGDCDSSSHICRARDVNGAACMTTGQPSRSGICTGGSCVCQPSCPTDHCGDNGCGKRCDCPRGKSCNSANHCICEPDCPNGYCGDDGCGRRCGCPRGKSCNSANECVCEPNCPNGHCGDDGCGRRCGCPKGKSCNSANRCVCTPNCPKDSCGDNGCGQPCKCASNKECRSGVCKIKRFAPCTRETNSSTECGNDQSYSCVALSAAHPPACMPNVTAGLCPWGLAPLAGEGMPCVASCTGNPSSDISPDCPDAIPVCAEFTPGSNGPGLCVRDAP